MQGVVRLPDAYVLIPGRGRGSVVTTRHGTARAPEQKVVSDQAAPWLWVSIAATLLAMAGSAIALAVGSIYTRLTPTFLPMALAQDIANLALSSPAMLIRAVLAHRGSLRAYLLWLGVLTFSVYNYVIYTFSVPFGPLFLLWVAVLGLCISALIGGVAAIDRSAVAARFASRRVILAAESKVVAAASLKPGPSCWRAALADCRGGAR